VLTQGEHAVLGLPYFYLHPCETPQRMGCLERGGTSPTKGSQKQQRVSEGLRYLLRWLSMMAPVIQLKVPAQFLALILFGEDESEAVVSEPTGGA
jgi:ubiquitin-like-conjugating enzyme ATG10